MLFIIINTFMSKVIFYCLSFKQAQGIFRGCPSGWFFGHTASQLGSGPKLGLDGIIQSSSSGREFTDGKKIEDMSFQTVL